MNLANTVHLYNGTRSRAHDHQQTARGDSSIVISGDSIVGDDPVYGRPLARPERHERGAGKPLGVNTFNMTGSQLPWGLEVDNPASSPWRTRRSSIELPRRVRQRTHAHGSLPCRCSLCSRG